VATANTEHWTTRKLLEWMTNHFQENAVESPRLISEMLLTHLFGGQRIDLYANIDRIATEDERDTLRSYIKRTIEHEPVQYIVGKTWFYGLEFDVNTSTLIPRTCTETIVEQAMLFASQIEASPNRIADIGTGSGCIAIMIAKHIKDATVVATDISIEALELAKQNAHNHGVDKAITFVEGSLTEPFSTLEPFNIICSNPPYIPDNEMLLLDKNVGDWEPKLALSGGHDGLKYIRPLLENSPDYLLENGILLIEIATSIKSEVLALAKSNPLLKEPKILRDRYGDDRFLRAIKC
jgi:release factor glutamine methyltransferase